MSPPDKGRRRGPACSNTHVFQGGAPGTDPAFSSTSSAHQDVPLPPRVQLSSPSEDQRKPRSRRGSNAPSTRSVSTSIASVSATSAAEALLKDKDMRIAQLERELAKESETASFWQVKHSALNQQFLRTDTELRLLRDDMSARQAAETDDSTRRWRDAMEQEMAGRDDEIRALRAQVRGLKEWVSTSTRVDGTANVSDEVFGDGWARLRNGLQNWVITNFRKAKLDLAKADETTLHALAELVPMYEDLLAQGAKAHLLQSLVSRILAQQVFGPYFVGLSAEQEEQMQRTEDLMATFGKHFRPALQHRTTRSSLAAVRFCGSRQPVAIRDTVSPEKRGGRTHAGPYDASNRQRHEQNQRFPRLYHGRRPRCRRQEQQRW